MTHEITLTDPQPSSLNVSYRLTVPAGQLLSCTTVRLGGQSVQRCVNHRLSYYLLKDVKPLYSLVSEMLDDRAPCTVHRFTHDPFPFVIISRYRDPIFFCLANVPPKARGAIMHAIFFLLHTIYGVHLKCEPHGDRFVWGEGSIVVCGVERNLFR